MIRHTVSFALVHPADSDEERRFLDDARRTLTSIDGVDEFQIARQVSGKSPHRFQFSMVFADADAYAAYDAHPLHQDFVASRWVPEVSDFQELDFIPWS
ncbi:Dabb family protein [Microbacterium sp. AZCO]|uniref:Dabb family protein n=1 Tax=Microbacterium sp. AZCO TaxID=3142976 RepID=UPI0031F4499E